MGNENVKKERNNNFFNRARTAIAEVSATTILSPSSTSNSSSPNQQVN